MTARGPVVRDVAIHQRDEAGDPAIEFIEIERAFALRRA